MGPYSVDQLLEGLTIQCKNGQGNRKVFLMTEGIDPPMNHIQPLISVTNGSEFALNDYNKPILRMCIFLQSDDAFIVKVSSDEPESKLTSPYTIRKLADELDKLSKNGCGEEVVVLFLNKDPKYMLNTSSALVEVREIEIKTEILDGKVVALFADSSVKYIG